MATPPARASLIPAGALLPSSFKVLLGQFYDYTVALLGSDGTPAKAREALNIPMRNYLDNPDGGVYQRTIAASADDVYMDDRWYALTQTGTITPSQVANPEDGYRYALRLTQSQAVAQRMGRAQIVEGNKTSELRGKTVTMGGRLKFSASATVRVALLAWTGAEDAVTSDVVNNWASAVYTPANFFAAANLAVIGTAAFVMTAATPGTVQVSGVVPSNATNLIAFYWTDAAAAQNVTLDAHGWRIVDAPSLVDYIRLPLGVELAACQRYYEITKVVARMATTTPISAMQTPVNFKFQKRAVPTIAVVNTDSSFNVTIGPVFEYITPWGLSVRIGSTFNDVGYTVDVSVTAEL